MRDNTVDDLRNKTEEADLNSFLKPVMGGYTKKSVLDYLAYLKGQQQNTKDADAEAYTRLQGDKERLQKENKTLEADLKEAVERIGKNEEELGVIRAELEKWRTEAEVSSKRAAEYERKLQTVCAENEELTQAIAEFCGESARELPPLPADFVMPTQKDEDEADEQMQTLLDITGAMQTEVTERAKLLEQQVLTLNELIRTQLKNSRGVTDRLRVELREQMDQTSLLESERDELTKRISVVSEQNVRFNNENTRLKAENVILQRRLETR